jgi:hypothetical protein
MWEMRLRKLVNVLLRVEADLYALDTGIVRVLQELAE